jgi:diaminohydroxyphosphoribosylaminopyrimidine deaminase/5-amino-6-(5-phosphoribosylamino)uracil reductase
VLFKSAMTLDGKVATRTGDSKWISGEDSRYRSHHWRAERDAVGGRDRHRAGRRSAADRARAGRLPPADAGRVRLRGAAAARLPARARRRRGAADRRRLARGVALATDALEAAGPR